LLLLRAAVGVLAVVHGAAALLAGNADALYTTVVGSLAIASGLALLAGFLTPIAGILAGLGAVGLALSWFSLPFAGQFEIRLIAILIVVVAVAVVLLGPGSLSLDARLFGRREIIIPRAPRSPNP
jgi:uncharacterized membrane protein YphA (DoxX/SURF4 family)